MAGMFDDLPDSKSAQDLFEDIPTQQPKAPAGKGFLRGLIDDIGASFSAPKSVLEGVKFDQPFDFNEASRANRTLDDDQARVQRYGTIGPVVGPVATAGSIATGLASDMATGAKTADAGIDRMIADAIGSEYMAKQSVKKRAQAGLTQAITTPEFETDTARAAYSGLSSTVRQLPSIAAALATRNPNIALGGMVAPMLPDSYGEFRERGATPGLALPAAAANTAIEFLTEKMPMGVIVDKFGKTGAKKFLADLLVKDMTGEQIATFTQDAIDTAVANPDKSWSDYWAERPGAAYQTAVATLTQGGVMGAAHRAAQLPESLRKRSDARALAGAIDADANALFDDIPQASVTPERVNRIFAQPTPAPVAPVAPEQAIPALGFDPTVQNPAPVMVADTQGNVRPMDSAEQFSQEQEAQRLADLGLTRDVMRAPRSEVMQQEPSPPGLDLIQRLLSGGWMPPNGGPQQTGTPDEVQADPELVAMLGQEFEKLYQGDIKGEIQNRLGLTPTGSAPVEKVKQSPLRAFLREMGIDPSLAKDITGEGGLRANNRLPGTFRKGGMNLDALVERAVERGFITPQEVESAQDNGGTNRLVELIQSELRGERQSSAEVADVTNQRLMQDNASADLEQRASAVGFDTKDMTDDQVAAALGRIDRRRAKVQAQKDAVWNAQQEAEAERAAIAQAEFIDAQIDAVLDGQSNMTTEDAMRALGFTEQEIQDATANQSEGSGQSSQSGRGPDGNATGPAPGAIGENSGSSQGQGESQAQTEGLSSYTPDELRQRQEEQTRAETERKARDQATEQRAKADAERDDFTLTGSDRAADVAAAAGQQDIFSGSAEQAVIDKPASQMSVQDLLRAAADKMDQKSGEKAPPATVESAQAATKSVAKGEAIQDFGEKIGGARKDLAGSTGRTRKATNNDERPAWARRFQISEIVAGEGAGRWVIRDTKNLDYFKQPKQVGRTTYATQEEAEAAVPFAAVSLKHRVVPTRKDTWEIWRDVSDRKRIKVVDQEFDTRDDAMRYMMENAAAIVETNSTFGEADLPKPASYERVGAERRQGDVDGQDFMDAFGFRGVEFGNWNNQAERQELMNAAYDGLMDLADVLGLPPKALALNGDLALAFGARGHGLSGARAHYETDRVVMNLTKMNGAGALAHEWFHALDHYFGRQDGKTPSEWTVGKDGTRKLDSKGGEADMASGGFLIRNSGVRLEIRDAYKALMETMYRKAEQYVEDTEKADKFVGAARNDVADQLGRLRKHLAAQLDARYYKRNNKPASAEQLAEFDTVVDQIVSGVALDTELRQTKLGQGKTLTGMRWTNDALEKLSEINKAVRGRTGFNADRTGEFDRLRSSMSVYSARLKMLADAQNSTEKTKKVPTSFAMDAKSLDQGRGQDYWTTPHEMAARAFQGYVEDKIGSKGGSSPFLNYGPANAVIPTPWGWKRPYPAGTERTAINQEFDNFVGTFKTEETDKGVRVFEAGKTFNPKDGRHVEFVQLTWPDGFQLVDAQRGRDKAHALELAHQNWANAKVKAITREQAEALDPGVGEDADRALAMSGSDKAGTDPYNAGAQRRNYANEKQLQLFLDKGPDKSQAGQAGEAAQRESVAAVGDLRSTENLLALALSSDLAARQRASLVGQKVNGPEDLAILAQVYRDPRFETFRVIFVNDKGGVVSQVGLTNRLPASTESIVGDDVDGYIKDLMATARNRGASGYYMLHNHPSGVANASLADRSMTRAWAARTSRLGGMDFHGHVIIDTNQYAVIEAQGNAELVRKDFGQIAPMTQGEFGGYTINSPADAMKLAKSLEVDRDAVTLVVTDSQHRVLNVTTLPNAAFGSDKDANRKLVVRAALASRGASIFAVGRHIPTLQRVGHVAVEAIHVGENGEVQSLTTAGLIRGMQSPFPETRRLSVTADTSPEFGYLRPFTQAQMQSRRAAAESGAPDATSRLRETDGQGPGSSDPKQVVGTSVGGKPALQGDFGRNTRIRGKNGPVTVYRGAGQKLTADHFRIDALGKATGNPSSGLGVWTTTGKAEAQRYGDVEAFQLDIRNPKFIKAENIPGFDSVEEANAYREKLRKQGFDGIVIDARHLGKPELHFVAFDADQVIRPDTLKAEASRSSYAVNGVQSAAAPWTVPEPGAGDAFIRAIQNNKIDLKRVRDSLAAQFGTVPVVADAYLGEELYQGRVSARVQNLHDERINPLLQKIAVAGKNFDVTVDDVNEYLHARHAPERNAAMQAINPGMAGNDALSGMSNSEAAATMQRFASSGKARALDSIAKDVDQLLADTRSDLVADGLEDAGVVQAWEQAYKSYVPLQRESGSKGTPRGMGFSVRGPEAKRAVGSKREVVNILANIVTQAETAAIRAEKAIVGRRLLAMARKYPNRDFWTVNEIPTKPRIDKDTGLVVRNAIDPMYQTADNTIMVKDYGVEHFITFNKDSERAMGVARAMKNLDIAPTNKLIEIAGKGTRFMASLLTQRNPLFWATNFARDIQGAMLNLEGTDAEGLQREALANLPKAFKGMHAVVRGSGAGQWARYAKEFAEAGGTTGYMQVFGDSDIRMKHLEKEVAKMAQGKADPRRLARNVLDFIDDYNDIVENAVRLTVFQSAREAGVSTPRAASIAKNITVNFNRKGNLTPTVNSLYMFFNASVQGTARLAQAITTSRTAQVAVGGIAMMGFLLDMIGRAMSDDDEETGRNRYDMIPEHEKANNWILMNPMRPGEYVKVPLPLGPHIFHNAGRLVSDAIFRKDPRNASEYGWSMANLLMGAFSPLGTASTMGQFVAPSLVDPILQVTENKSFTGGPVYKSSDRGFGNTDPKPAYTRHFENTPELWKSASKMLNDMTGGDRVKPGALNIEPDILGHVFYTLTGGPGRTLVQGLDTASTGARGESVSVNRVPMVSRFYGANDDRQRERVYYDERKRTMDAKIQFDYFVKAGRQDLAREVATELGDGDAAAGRKKMREIANAEKLVRKINGEMRRKMEKDDDGQAQAEQLRALRERRMRVMSNAVDDDE